jgi:hypothetical protein
MKSSGFADERGAYFHYRRSWRRRRRFWIMASMLCLLAALLAFSVYWVFQSAPPFLFGPYKDLQERDIEKMDRYYRELERAEVERIKREEGFRERRGEKYRDVYKRGGY